jgi:hypothetical protein
VVLCRVDRYGHRLRGVVATVTLPEAIYQAVGLLGARVAYGRPDAWSARELDGYRRVLLGAEGLTPEQVVESAQAWCDSQPAEPKSPDGFLAFVRRRHRREDPVACDACSGGVREMARHYELRGRAKVEVFVAACDCPAGRAIALRDYRTAAVEARDIDGTTAVCVQRAPCPLRACLRCEAPAMASCVGCDPCEGCQRPCDAPQPRGTLEHRQRCTPQQRAHWGRVLAVPRDDPAGLARAWAGHPALQPPPNRPPPNRPPPPEPTTAPLPPCAELLGRDRR